jgi:hypothetical protein
MSIEAAREAVASRYPTHITDSLGRPQENIPRRNILGGRWDGGSLVREALAQIEGKEE